MTNAVDLRRTHLAIASTILSISFLAITFLFQPFAYGQPAVQISPTCGPESGFNVEVSADGFRPDTEVNWQLIGSDEIIPLSGYFETNGVGQISDTTFADDLKKDHYKMYFGEDANGDGEFDAVVIPVYVELNIPCGKED